MSHLAPTTGLASSFVYQRIYESKLSDALYNAGLRISPLDALVIAELAKEDGRKPSELAALCGRMPTSFTPVLDRQDEKLVSGGLIKRCVNESDRRSVFIRLSASGVQVAQKVLRIVNNVEKSC